MKEIMNQQKMHQNLRNFSEQKLEIETSFARNTLLPLFKRSPFDGSGQSRNQYNEKPIKKTNDGDSEKYSKLNQQMNELALNVDDNSNNNGNLESISKEEMSKILDSIEMPKLEILKEDFPLTELKIKEEKDLNGNQISTETTRI